jgi:hypothetical protein
MFNKKKSGRNLQFHKKKALWICMQWLHIIFWLTVIQKYFILHEVFLEHKYLIFWLFILSLKVHHASCDKKYKLWIKMSNGYQFLIPPLVGDSCLPVYRMICFDVTHIVQWNTIHILKPTISTYKTYKTIL